MSIIASSAQGFLAHHHLVDLSQQRGDEARLLLDVGIQFMDVDAVVLGRSRESAYLAQAVRS
jgi:hypothetical protein